MITSLPFCILMKSESLLLNATPKALPTCTTFVLLDRFHSPFSCASLSILSAVSSSNTFSPHSWHTSAGKFPRSSPWREKGTSCSPTIPPHSSHFIFILVTVYDVHLCHPANILVCHFNMRMAFPCPFKEPDLCPMLQCMPYATFCEPMNNHFKLGILIKQQLVRINHNN